MTVAEKAIYYTNSSKEKPRLQFKRRDYNRAG